MKTSFAFRPFATLFTAALLLSGTSALAASTTEPTEPVSVRSADHESYRVRVAAAPDQRGRVQVTRLASGQVLFDQAYAGPAYAHRFNFRNLPAGEYAMVVKLGRETYRYTVQVDTDAAGLVSSLRTVRVRTPKGLMIAAAL